jgi:tRNA G18 (ribose-2'-O)-methylase SpoU
MRAPRRSGQTGTMAGIVVVDDPSDPRLADYARLTDVRLRTALEPAHGLFVAEGDKVIRRAVAAGFQVRSMLVTQDKLAGLADVAGACPGPVYLVSDDAAEQVTGYRVHRGALASMARRALPTVTGLLSGAPLPGDLSAARLPGDLSAARLPGDLSGAPLSGALSGGPLAGEGPAAGAAGPAPAGTAHKARDGQPRRPRRIVILEDLVDHGNVGGIFRCAAALGVDAVILSPRCADPLYRRAVKVSMGAVFAIPYARMSDWRGGLAEIRAAGFSLLALTPDQSAVPLDKLAPAGRVALLLGTEGDGLSSRWLAEADTAVYIPMSAGAMALGVDSLNVVAAAAIACHELARLPGC